MNERHSKYKEMWGHDFYKAALNDLADAKAGDNPEKLDAIIDVLSELLTRADPGDGEMI